MTGFSGLRCDGVEPRWSCSARAEDDSANLTVARTRLTRAGWSTDIAGERTVDLCPDCTTKREDARRDGRTEDLALLGVCPWTREAPEIHALLGHAFIGHKTTNLLVRDGIRDLAALRRIDDDRLLGIRGFGPSNLALVRTFVPDPVEAEFRERFGSEAVASSLLRAGYKGMGDLTHAPDEVLSRIPGMAGDAVATVRTAVRAWLDDRDAHAHPAGHDEGEQR